MLAQQLISAQDYFYISFSILIVGAVKVIRIVCSTAGNGSHTGNF